MLKNFLYFYQSLFVSAMVKYFFLLVSFVTILTSCQKSLDDGGGSNSLPAQTLLNVSYGSDALQKMDIYLPAGRSSATTKVMIMIHGGGWSTGDKADFADYVDTIKKRQPDYAIFNINYRLASGGTNTFPTQENDVKDAVDFILSKSGEYHVSQKIVLLGASAGGHLALLQGYKNSSTVKPKAIVDFFGPTDMTALYNASNILAQGLLASIVGGTPTTSPTIYMQSSPINYVTAQTPPTIIFQGGADPLVPISQSVSLDGKLQTMGVTNQYVFYPTEGHGWVGANLSDSFDKLQAFLAANVN
jgi:acetyl esterase/lipase